MPNNLPPTIPVQNINLNNKKDDKVNITIPLIIGGTLVVLTIAVGSLVLMTSNNSGSNNTNTTPTNTTAFVTTTPLTTTTSSTNTSTSSTTTTTTNIASTKYRDGTYTASGSFSTPDGRETVSVTLTINNDTISSVSVTNNARGESYRYTQDFISGINDIVVGKSLDTNFDVSYVNGASLTGTGFMNAISSIKNQCLMM